MAIKIAFTNHKGGVGKTTSTLNVGVGLSNRKHKVLLLDLDPQANLTQCFNTMNTGFTIYGSMKGEYPLRPIHLSKYLHIVPSCLDLAGIELEIGAKIGREKILRKLIQPIENEYDFILIDSPPSLGLIIVNIFTATDQIFIPLQAEFLALHGLDKLIEIMQLVKGELNPELELGGVFLTQFNQRKVLNRDIKEMVYEYFAEKVLNTDIRDNISIAEAPASNLDIFSYAPKSTGAIDYKKLVLEIIKKFNQNGKKEL